MEAAFGACIRRAIDEVLDGPRTGRYDITDKELVASTEKTYLGTKVEIIVRDRFKLPRGKHMDFLVAGHEVDAKWTIRKNWTIPPEADGHVCLLLAADDHTSSFRVGLQQIGHTLINPGKNRDQKSGLSAAGRKTIDWLVPSGKLPVNLLLHLPQETRNLLYQPTTGQKRVNALFRHVLGTPIHRSVIQTLAQQQDYMARIREDNGNSRARPVLRREGIVILGGDRNRSREIAAALGGPVPGSDEFVAFKIARKTHHHTDRPYAVIDGHPWVAVDTGEEAPDHAPKIQASGS